MPANDINQIIDLERYPLNQPDHPAYAQLLAAGRRSLEDKALFSMAQWFVRAESIVAMVKELEGLLPMSLGDFNVFLGDLSLHRVTPVEGERKRIVALFSYDRNPGTTFDQWYIRQLNQGLPN